MKIYSVRNPVIWNVVATRFLFLKTFGIDIEGDFLQWVRFSPVEYNMEAVQDIPYITFNMRSHFVGEGIFKSLCHPFRGLPKVKIRLDIEWWENIYSEGRLPSLAQKILAQVLSYICLYNS